MLGGFDGGVGVRMLGRRGWWLEVGCGGVFWLKEGGVEGCRWWEGWGWWLCVCGVFGKSWRLWVEVLVEVSVF